ncbi:MAG: FAD-binding protein [Holdemania massiliensis]
MNEQGQRFTNEYGSETDVSIAILSQSHHKAFLLADAHNSNITEGKTSGGRDLEEAVAQGYVFKADTIEALAQQLQIDPAVLTQTIEQFNAAIDQKQDPEFGRTILNEEDKLLTAPFYATPVIPSVHHTMGGLKINAKAQVLNQQDEPISGLFAAGEIVGGLSGNNRMSGDAIMANVVQGRVAGAEAANND